MACVASPQLYLLLSPISLSFSTCCCTLHGGSSSRYRRKNGRDALELSARGWVLGWRTLGRRNVTVSRGDIAAVSLNGGGGRGGGGRLSFSKHGSCVTRRRALLLHSRALAGGEHIFARRLSSGRRRRVRSMARGWLGKDVEERRRRGKRLRRKARELSQDSSGFVWAWAHARPGGKPAGGSVAGKLASRWWRKAMCAAAAFWNVRLFSGVGRQKPSTNGGNKRWLRVRSLKACLYARGGMAAKTLPLRKTAAGGSEEKLNGALRASRVWAGGAAGVRPSWRIPPF